MSNKKKVELLVVYVRTCREAWDVLGDEAGLFSDKGGDPDGPSYYRPTAELSDEAIDRICNCRLGHVELGEKVEYRRAEDGKYDSPTEENIKGWCGYQADGVAYVTYQRSATHG